MKSTSSSGSARLPSRRHLLPVAASLLLAAIAGCTSPENSILITARAVEVSGATGITTVRVIVIPTDSTTAPERHPAEPITRTFAQINGDLPIHVAVRLRGPTPVAVHIVAQASNGTLLYATRCYAPNGAAVTDEVLLVQRDITADVDGDGFPAAGRLDATCRDPGPGANGVACDVGLCPGSAVADCNDSADVFPGPCDRAHGGEGRCIFPGADAVCGDTIDQDCRNNGEATDDEPCIDADGDGFPACAGASGMGDAGIDTDGGVGGDAGVDDAGPIDRGCDCADNDPARHPGVDEICGNMLDDDCSGEPGGMGSYCDADGDGFTSNVDCDDMNPDIHPGDLSLEACAGSGPGCNTGGSATCTGVCDCVDNNCNGLVDEHSSCAGPDLDGDGTPFCTGTTTDCTVCDCNDCDSGRHPGAIDQCGDGIDANGDGNDACDPADTDRDGVVGGRDCEPTNARAYLDAPEECMTPVEESCGTGTAGCSVDGDGDHYSPNGPGVVDCDDGDDQIHPWADDICDGINNDCDLDGDEVLDPANLRGCVTDPSCPATSPRCEVQFQTNIHHCGECRNECNEGSTLEADVCSMGRCSCSTNTAGGGAECGTGDTCCVEDAMGMPVANPGCFTLSSAMENCGGCGNVCDTEVANLCTLGVCMCGTNDACGMGDTCCPAAGGSCFDLQNDRNNCGACGFVCGADSTCNAGRCQCADVDHADCNNDLAMPVNNGCEIDLRTDAANCGACRNSCTDQNVASGVCSARACVINTCNFLFDDCNTDDADGCETDLSQVANCGSCRNTCMAMAADARCIVGGAGAACGFGMCMGTTGDCDGNVGNGCETNLRAVATCGNCTSNCGTLIRNGTGQLCTSGGTCDYAACTSGFSDCDAGRANGCETAWSTTTCGPPCTNCTVAAGHATGQLCTAGGACDYGACSGRFSDCDGNRTNGCEAGWSAAQCGGMCTNCATTTRNATGQLCSAGGTCDFTACTGSFSDCDANRANGCETAWSVGACGLACTNCSTAAMNATGQSCTAGGICDFGTCSGAFSNCDGNRANGCEQAWGTTRCGPMCTNCSTTVLRATGQMCTGGGTCDFGACTAGSSDCNGNRADGCELWTTGTCGSGCTNCNMAVANATGRLCTAGGTCDFGACSSGFSSCDANRANGCETAWATGTCGPMCTNCATAILHATATCAAAGTCDYSGTCDAGWADCDGNRANGCEAAANTAMRCGSCGNNCTDDPNISAGMCTAPPDCDYTCMGSFLDCTAASGCETNGATTATRCGSCGNDCTDDPGITSATCATGMCSYTCSGTNLDCTAASGCETNGATTATRCGSCGNDCTDDANISSATCATGMCNYTCSGTFLDCTATAGCESAGNVAARCGSCTNDCTDDPNQSSSGCTAGACTYTCTGAFLDCTTGAGCETNGDTSATRCGSCTNDCTDDANITAATCMSGSCDYTCSGTFLDCVSGTPGCETNGASSATHCGSCANDCTDQGVMTGSCGGGGNCVITACDATHANCDGNPNNGCESTLISNSMCCGSAMANDCTMNPVGMQTCVVGTGGVRMCGAP